MCVSACLLGERCKYNGGDNLAPGLAEALARAGHEVVAVCPEMAGGLGCPRPPAEIRDGRVVTREGTDVTAAFQAGVTRSLEQLGLTGRRGRPGHSGRPGHLCDCAILQPRSPSCGVGRIYDGTFSGRLIPGNGLFAQALIDRGIPVRPWDKGDSPLCPTLDPRR